MNEKIKYHHFLVVLWMTVSFWGIINVFSASYKRYSSAGLSVLGSITTLVALFIFFLVLIIYLYRHKHKAYNLMYKTVNFQFYASLVMLFIVLIPKFIAPIYFTSVNIRGGAYSVIPLGFFDVQPVEYFKITAILYFAKQVTKVYDYDDFWAYIKHLIWIPIGMCLVLYEVDTGGTMIIFFVMVILLYLNQEHIKVITQILVGATVLVLSAIAGLILVVGSDYYVLDRFRVWLNPFVDATGSGRELIYSLVAFSNGGLLGEGYLNSNQAAGYFVNSASSDYIFAIIAEDWGFMGVLLAIGLPFLIGFVSIKVGQRALTKFDQFYAMGYGFLIIIQTFIITGGVSGVIPLTGVPLPFQSNASNAYLFSTLGLIYVILIDLETNKKIKKEEEKANRLFI